ncbi:hypothetical protein MSAS_12080 [Mycobacterium saskatchewanense]|uniref:FAD-binding domain-containing protein n=1 Tax=Mycobacterium saskatchewanense TaxID=220927 RepID=A0AAJ3NR09_9MYCO|nr:hypothetical protein [Mycobacterium saskatchewanense]ORW71867.1 hypothetical protein AWC23_12335 [Mycobacterium saskatchewanense]BBX62034.1 hypothetical protein MSAS_12080 [Mycobacterium saskatchewanense]
MTGRAVVLGAGIAGLPTDLADMLAFAEDFVPTHIWPALRSARPLTPVSTYGSPGGVWRRYDHIRCPQGLLVLGDALCCLDPINGRGMTMAALHAHALRTQLRRANPVDPQAFYADVATLIKPVWAVNQPSDRTTGRSRRSLSQRAVRWSRRNILEVAERDIVVTERLSRVANPIDPPRRLLEPPFLARVVAHHTRGSLALKR